ncbi:MAG: AAA family ATPase [Synechococcus sp. SB0678_bin_12]|nr:AAA family ATPase [Synechococcus sp. SB0678_bin_12]
MLTRLEVNGFKNLVNFSLDFGPYTCIAGPNGAGKSNIFDAIRFLSLLTDYTINEAALQTRNAGEETGNIQDLLFLGAGERSSCMRFSAEMIVDKKVRDDFGREAEASSSFLRYEIAFRYAEPSPTTGFLGGLLLEKESLDHIRKGEAVHRLRFPNRKNRFLNSIVHNNRRGAGFISTKQDPTTGQAAISVHQDGGSRGRERPSPATMAAKTIIGTENTSFTPTILAARNEMRSWRVLALDPAAMRRPDHATQLPGIAANGAHIPATLQHLAHTAAQDDPEYDVYGQVSRRLSELVPVQRVSIDEDKQRQRLALEIVERSGLKLQANSISDGTLRFLALAALSEIVDESAVICMEEPENGIHPAKLNAMNQLLHDIAVDPEEAVAPDNPLRQVIVATHSPYFVQLQDRNDLVLAKNPAVRSAAGKVILPLKCYSLKDSWRDRARQSPGVGMLDLQSYIAPPEYVQLRFPEIFEDVK